MADQVKVLSASGLIHTGHGQLVGVVITCSSTNPALAIFYDHDEGSGTKVLEAYVASPQPLVIMFPERLAPAFIIGLYLTLAANLTATVWSRNM